MTTNEVTILTSLLSLSNKATANDPTVDADVTAINTVTKTDTTFAGTITDSVNTMIDNSTAVNEAVVAKIISTLTTLATTKDLLIGLLTARNVDMRNRQAVADFIDFALASMINDFQYYTAVVRLAIFLGDSARIRATIIKIQSLGV